MIRISASPLCRLFLSMLIFTSVVRLANATGKSENPNIVIILVDDMGYGDAACYNPASKISMPQVESLAKAGMRFTDAHAPGPLCHLSRYGLMTGRYPFRSSVKAWRQRPSIDADQMTIASLLRDQGYHTAMVGKWHLGFDESKGYEHPLPGGPADRGFNSYFGIRASTDIPPYFYIRGDKAVEPPTEAIDANYSEGWTRIQGAFWRKGGIAPNLKLENVLPEFTDEAVAVIDRHAETQKSSDSPKPLMLYLAYPAPHTPWLPSTEFVGTSKASMYGDFAAMVDAMIGKVLKSLDDNGMSEDTLVIFSSDNGPVWYENDVERFDHDSSGGLKGMKADAWECGHRMPFLVRWPGKVQPGSVSDQTICFTDCLATFASIVGTDLPNDAGPDSFNFLPVLLGKQSEKQPIRDSLVMESGGGLKTVRVGDWKLIDGLGSGGFSKPSRIKPKAGEPQGQLYNLKDDLAETKNMYDQKPEIVRLLKAKLQQVIDSGRSR